MAALQRRLLPLAAVVMALGVLAAVWYFAFSAGVNKGLQESYYCHILHGERELSALDNLQRQDVEGTRSNLETGLNLSVVLLSGSYPMMDERALQSSREILLKIKKHREQNPWVGYDENLQQRIQSALNTIHDQPQARP